MKTEEYINRLLSRHFCGEELTAEQQSVVDEWIDANREEYRRLQRLIGNAGRQIPVDFDAAAAWKRIEPQLTEKRAIRIPFFRRESTLFAIAASLVVALVVGAYFLTLTPEAELLQFANAGQVEKVIWLPDSSQVKLAPDARLTFRNGEVRQAQLEGKAFFHVKKQHGKPFRVSTLHLQVEVLGTSFLVNASPEEVPGVYVETGKVKVSAQERDVILQASQMVEVTGHDLQVEPIEQPYHYFGVEDRELVFKNTPLQEVTAEVEKYTGVRIELGPGFEKTAVTTRIRTLEAESIAAELAFLCGCRCDTLTAGKAYRLYFP